MILIVDLDGTLFNVQGRLNACLSEANAFSLESMDKKQRKAFWECFQSPKYMDFDIPNERLISLLKEAKEKGHQIVLLTGRDGEKQREKTIEQIKKFDIPADYIIFRSPNDRRPAEEFKMSVVLPYASLSKIAVVDDDKDLIQKLKEYGIKAYLPHEFTEVPEAKEEEKKKKEIIPPHIPAENPPVIVKLPKEELEIEEEEEVKEI